MPDETYIHLLSRLNLVKRREKKRLLLKGAISAFLAFFPMLLLFFLLDNLFSFPSPLRVVCLALCLIISGWMFLKEAWEAFFLWSNERIAVRLEKIYPALDNQLINAVQLGKKSGSPLVHRIIEEALNVASRFRSSDPSEKRIIKKRLILLIGSLGLFAGYLAILPEGFFNAAERFLKPMSSLSPLSATILTVRPGDVTLAKGEALQVEAEVSGNIARELFIEIEAEDATSKAAMSFDGRRFVFTRDKTRNHLKYRVLAKGAKSPWFRVNVVEKPEVKEFFILYQYPDYTGWERKEVRSPRGDLRGIAGTEVDLRIETTKLLKEASLGFSEGGKIPFVISSDDQRIA